MLHTVMTVMEAVSVMSDRAADLDACASRNDSAGSYLQDTCYSTLWRQTISLK